MSFVSRGARRSAGVLPLFVLALAAPDARAADPIAVDDGSGGAEAPLADSYADADPSALTDFHPALDEHGTWVDDESYGTVWIPSAAEVGADFTPYSTAGHWLYEDEYVWASDYAWGWAPFHYGRWIWAGLRGWVWIPGRAYAGAWVVWRVSADGTSYLGWAPMSPAWVWLGGVPVGVASAVPSPFVFCSRDDVFSPVVASRVVRGEPAAALLPETRPYVRATPTVGRPQPVMHGPVPSLLGIDNAHIARVPLEDRRVRRAQMFARPSTAMPAGARAPAPHIVRVLPPRPMMPIAPMRSAPTTHVRPRR